MVPFYSFVVDYTKIQMPITIRVRAKPTKSVKYWSIKSLLFFPHTEITKAIKKKRKLRAMIEPHTNGSNEIWQKPAVIVAAL